MSGRSKEIHRLIIEKSEGMTGSEDEIFTAEEVYNDAESEEEEGNLPEDQGQFCKAPPVIAAIVPMTNRDSRNGNTDGSIGRSMTAATASSISPHLQVSLKKYYHSLYLLEFHVSLFVTARICLNSHHS